MHQRILLPLSEDNKIHYISFTTLDSEFKAIFHSHANLEILFFTKGKGVVQTQSKEIVVNKGDVMMINRNSLHREVSEDQLEFYAIGVTDNEIYLSNDFKKKIIYLSISEFEQESIKTLYEMMFREGRLKKNNSIMIINHYYSALIALIQRQVNIVTESKSGKDHSQLVASIINVIDNYYYLNITITQLAKRFSVSESLILHQFKKEMDCSIMEYKLERQLQEAYNLLCISDLSIGEISSSVGFNSLAYFTKTFKKRFNSTPKEFRATHKDK